MSGICAIPTPWPRRIIGRLVAPFYIEQESPVPEGGVPKPGKLAVNLPDNHLQYAITWFGLALALAGVYVVWLARRLAGRD